MELMSSRPNAADPDRIGPRRAAVMFPVRPGDYLAVARALGPGWAVEDATRCRDPQVIVVRPCSPQTLVGLRRRFGAVPVVILDPDDPLADWKPEGWATRGVVAATETPPSQLASRR